MKELAKYRMKMAEEKLESSKVLLDAGMFKDSIGRSYYSVFSSVRALLAEREIDFKKHAGVISYFQREYVKTKLFEKKYSDYLQNAFEIRNSCDYEDFFIASKVEAEEQYQHAVEFLDEVKRFLSEE